MIITAFRALAAKARGEVSAEVTSATPLSHDQVANLADTLKQKIGKTVITTRWALLFAILSFISIGLLRLPLVGTLLVLAPISIAFSVWRGER